MLVVSNDVFKIMFECANFFLVVLIAMSLYDGLNTRVLCVDFPTNAAD